MVNKDFFDPKLDSTLTRQQTGHHDPSLRPRRPHSPVRTFQQTTFVKGREMIDGKYQEKPEMTREYREKLNKTASEPLLKFKWVDNFKDPNFIVPGNNKVSYKAQWKYKTPEDLIAPPDPMKWPIKPQWYPKNLDVSLPRVKFYSIDPDYYVNPPKHLIENKWGAHKAPPKVEPRFVQKWRSQEGWNDKSIRGCFKITEHPPPRLDLAR